MEAMTVERVVKEQGKIHGLLTEWMSQEASMHESLVLTQRHLIEEIGKIHKDTKLAMGLETSQDDSSKSQASLSTPQTHPKLAFQEAQSKEPTRPSKMPAISSGFQKKASIFPQQHPKSPPPSVNAFQDASSLTPAGPPAPAPALAHPGAPDSRQSLSSRLFRASLISKLGPRQTLLASSVDDGMQDNEVHTDAAWSDWNAKARTIEQDDSHLALWRQCSGLHTVRRWVTNYRGHDAGWGALLMIHGVEKTTARLVRKVENYCIYSALFLSMSLMAVCNPSELWVVELKESYEPWSSKWWELQVARRIYTYFFLAGSALHMLAILLGMSFVNAMNETARDSDIYRMFQRGEVFKATVKCQISFRLGCLFDFIAIGVAASLMVTGIEIAVLWLLLFFTTLQIYWKAAGLLFSSGSIVKYWRSELGGNPDPDDPYDLQIPLAAFQRRAKVDQQRRMSMFTGHSLEEADEEQEEGEDGESSAKKKFSAHSATSGGKSLLTKSLTSKFT
eukprot:CAMPEP_0197629710 /NCGR_PEP_ID=MMETSP1338-20131121/7452_1 /TAXON_ID=43686 ORGANISM="Pelagodinium beii, Strain RCC1491" /NCGR_SAMPLE_ID=MMETSP1338 /ASSEMBLY_ACC=CAM_ASM_000754 /LENGTH=504 /DNA_ID=CAMNT_0043200793 /DNA_START=83 /DNA_END=1593 /DNA_ORIENTATION=-